MISATPSDDRHVVRVWYTQTADLHTRDAGAVTRALTLLRPVERTRYDRYRREVDRDMFLVGRVMARAIVADALHVPAPAWAWREGPRGRPEVDAPDCPVSFNLAHSNGMVVCALSWLGPVGVDIEHRDRGPVARALVARCCHEDEAADIEAHGSGWRDRFLQYWTLKESYLKAVGLGLSVHLPDVRFALDDGVRGAFLGALAGADQGWSFDLTAIDAHHFVAVAAATADGRRPRVEYLPFPDRWWP